MNTVCFSTYLDLFFFSPAFGGFKHMSPIFFFIFYYIKLLSMVFLSKVWFPGARCEDMEVQLIFAYDLVSCDFAELTFSLQNGFPG